MDERFRETSAGFLESFLRRIEACVARLSEEQVWWRPNAAVNSVGNLLLHLQGNLSQWVLASLGGVAYQRRRSEEFAADRTASKAELLAGLRGVVEACAAVIRRLSPAELGRRLHIQGYDTDGLYAVLHAVEHMSYHTGQIAHISKELLGPEGGIDFFPQHSKE